MRTFKQHLAENYKNFIGAESKERREEYADRVWTMLQKAYAPIGGIKGSGFESKQAMIDKLPFWKIFTRGDDVKAAVFYKDKNGRKSVAVATDGTPEGKKILTDIYKNDLKVSYGEKSGPALGLLLKTVDSDYLANFFMTPEQVSKLTGDECIPVKKFGVENLDSNDKRTWDKFPQLHDFFYVRELGGEMHMKATFGTPGLKIRG